MDFIQKIMQTRQTGLSDALEGIDKSNVLGVSYGPNGYYASGYSDDQGLYYFAQMLHSSFGFNLIDIISFFHIFFIASGFIMNVVGLLLISKSRLSTLFGLLLVTMTALISLKIGDVYILFYFITSFILIFLHFARTNKNLVLILFGLGILISLSNWFRSHSGTGVLLFLMFYILFNSQFQFKRKAVLTAFFFLGLFSTKFLILQLNQNRNDYLSQSIQTSVITEQHPIWHSLYIGLGYIHNPYVEKYRDEIAMAKVKSVNPNAKYLSHEYENVLKNEFFNILYKHPAFFLENLGAKFGVIFLYFIIFSNLGLYVWYRNLKMYKLAFLKDNIPFIATLGFYSLFGFLVVPFLSYLLGFISMSAIIAIYAINYDYFLSKSNKVINDSSNY